MAEVCQFVEGLDFMRISHIEIQATPLPSFPPSPPPTPAAGGGKTISPSKVIKERH